MIYRHHKGGLYRVLFNATESTNARVGLPLGVVVYVSLTTGAIHTRDAHEFHGWIDDTETVRRFEATR